MKKRFAAALLAALMLLSLAACASWDPGTYSNDPMSELYDYYQPDAPEETPALTAFVLPCLSGVTLDPITCPDGIQLTVAALLYEPLYRLTPQFETENVLAQSESYDVETFTYTIRLRSGVRFSDGTALTAQDVAATLLRAQQSPRYAARLTDVVSVTAAGSDAVTIQLAQDRRSFTSPAGYPHRQIRHRSVCYAHRHRPLRQRGRYPAAEHLLVAHGRSALFRDRAAVL